MDIYEQIEQIEALAKKNSATQDLFDDLKAKISSAHNWALSHEKPKEAG